MAVEAFVQSGPHGLSAATSVDAEALQGLTRGVTYRATITRAVGRSVRQHNLFWALCKIVSDNVECFPPLSTEAAANLLKLRAGHATPVSLADGTVVFVPASISFAKADQDTFNRFFGRALDVVVRDLLPEIPSSAVRAEIEAMTSGSGQAPRREAVNA